MFLIYIQTCLLYLYTHEGIGSNTDDGRGASRLCDTKAKKNFTYNLCALAENTD